MIAIYSRVDPSKILRAMTRTPRSPPSWRRPKNNVLPVLILRVPVFIMNPGILWGAHYASEANVVPLGDMVESSRRKSDTRTRFGQSCVALALVVK